MTSYAITGLGVTEIGRVDRSVLELEAEAARLAILDAGLSPVDVGAAVQMASDMGGYVRTRHDDAFPRVLNLPVNVYFENVGRGGELACMAIVIATRLLDLGIADYVVCSGARDTWSRSRRANRDDKGTRGNPHRMVKEGTWAQYFGADMAPGFHPLLATRYMHRYGATSEDFGAIAVAQRKWANLNPDAAFYTRKMTIADHQQSPWVVWPYHLPDCSVQSDGGVAFVVTTIDRARDARSYVEIAGVGFGEQLAEQWWQNENYGSLAIDGAKAQAFGQAGIGLGDIDVAQLYDCFTTEVILQLEGYGWCEPGSAGAFSRSGATSPGGEMPVNTGGGLLSAYHLGNTTGLLEAIRQLRDEADERQVTGAEVALVTGHGGEILSGQMCSIHSCLVLRKGA
jgi:acetyl-CoA acetyltransferase